MTSPRRHQITHGIAPFGDPDGASGDLRDVQDHFVDLSRGATAGDLASRPDDRTVRVLVGKKGVGKTIYLRRFQASASDEESLFAGKRETKPPLTEDVLRATQLYSPASATESWRLIWRRAIQRSAISHLLCHTSLVPYLEDEIDEQLRRRHPDLVPDCSVPRPIYAEVTDIIRSHHTRDKLSKYLADTRWVEIEHWLGRALRDAPPMYLYIDALDDNFQRAPMYWLKCQKGLFYEVMAMADDDVNNRLHVVVCIRDIVLSSVLRGDQAGRYMPSRHIRKLEWDIKTVRFFLAEKLRRLGDELMLAPELGGVAGWLGRTEIRNRARRRDERVEDYILRHTRLIPRDVVALGNALCQAVAEARLEGRTELPDEVLRRVVGKEANRFAAEQVRACAHQIAADQVPEHGARNGSADYFVGSDEYSEGMGRQLIDLLGEVGKDRFDYDTVLRLAERGHELLHGYEHLLDVLWQNGLLGYELRENGHAHAHFYASSHDDNFHLPVDKKSYVVHPCLPHLARISHMGRTPVTPYRAG
jgi:hypothetical protein